MSWLSIDRHQLLSRRALTNLSRLDYKLVEAVDARSELDLRVGAAMTRFQTKRLQNKFPELAKHVISYGSH